MTSTEAGTSKARCASRVAVTTIGSIQRRHRRRLRIESRRKQQADDRRYRRMESNAASFHGNLPTAGGCSSDPRWVRQIERHAIIATLRMAQGALIDVDSLVFRWPSASSPCLAIESLRIDAGERIFLFGPSGSGKSTLLALLAGVLTAQEGTDPRPRHRAVVAQEARSLSRRPHRIHLSTVQSRPLSLGRPQRAPALPLLGEARATGNRGSWYAGRRRAAFAGCDGARGKPAQAQGDGPVGRPAAARGGGARAYRFP